MKNPRLNLPILLIFIIFPLALQPLSLRFLNLSRRFTTRS